MKLKHVKKGPVRIGVVGCGVVADYGHIPAIHRCPEARLVGFVDPDPQRRQLQADKYKLPCFASFDEMVKAVPMDAVAIPTHPQFKLGLIRIAAAHGLHAFCEKPLTATTVQARKLVKLMDDAGLFVGVSFVYRGKQEVQRMMQLVREGAIGKLRAVHIENMWDYHGLRSNAWSSQYAGRRQRALLNMGTLDCGVHNLDLARYMSGAEFGPVSAIGAIVEAANKFPDHLAMQSRMKNGVMVTVEESAVWGFTAKETPHYQQSYRMVGENGVLTARHDFSKKSHKVMLDIVSGEKQWTEESSSEKAWDDTYKQFFQVILGEKITARFIADGHDALANMVVAQKVIDLCMKAEKPSTRSKR